MNKDEVLISSLIKSTEEFLDMYKDIKGLVEYSVEGFDIIDEKIRFEIDKNNKNIKDKT